MTIEPPKPPTAPAPAVRPTPPTPPKIDMSPFAKDKGEVAKDKTTDATPEAQARDAVAHGSGPLTKRTVDRGDKTRDADDKPAPPNQTVTVIPPDAPLVPNDQSDYDRGKDVLRQFRDMDARATDNPQTATEQPPTVTPRLNHYQEGHGVVYWLFTIIFVAVAAFFVVKKFLFTDNPALTKSQLFEDSSERLKAASEKVKPVTSTTKPVRTLNASEKLSVSEKVKPVTSTKDSDKGKHFEVRI